MKQVLIIGSVLGLLAVAGEAVWLNGIVDDLRQQMSSESLSVPQGAQ
jgi:hypothetical protein